MHQRGLGRALWLASLAVGAALSACSSSGDVWVTGTASGTATAGTTSATSASTASTAGATTSASATSGTTTSASTGRATTGTSGSTTGRVGTTSAASSTSGSTSASTSGTTTSGTLPFPTFTCDPIAASSVAPDSSTDAVEADLLTTDTTDRVIDNGAAFTLVFTTRVTAADTVDWQILDDQSALQLSGSFAVPSGTTVQQMQCQSTRAGYFATTANLKTAGTGLLVRGSRPAGFMSFGVLPALGPALGTAVYPHLDDHRFGVQGTNHIDGVWLEPVYAHLGVVWVNDNRDWSRLEPTASGQYDPTTFPATRTITPEDYAKDGLIRYITVDGIPGWANSSGAASDAYPPTSFTAYGSFLGEVAQETVTDHTDFPAQQNDYYQVTWEPDPGTGNAWKGTAAEFVTPYQPLTPRCMPAIPTPWSSAPPSSAPSTARAWTSHPSPSRSTTPPTPAWPGDRWVLASWVQSGGDPSILPKCRPWSRACAPSGTPWPPAACACQGRLVRVGRRLRRRLFLELPRSPVPLRAWRARGPLTLAALGRRRRRRFLLLLDRLLRAARLWAVLQSRDAQPRLRQRQHQPQAGRHGRRRHDPGARRHRDLGPAQRPADQRLRLCVPAQQRPHRDRAVGVTPQLMARPSPASSASPPRARAAASSSSTAWATPRPSPTPTARSR